MNKLGNQTIMFSNPPYILETASIVGPKESQGPLAKFFDQCLEDEFWGEKTWEKAESKIIKENVNALIAKSGIASSQIDYCFAGDLLNQCISSSFGLREINMPFFGIFGACSTFVEGMSLGSVFIDSGAGNKIICATSSHFCSAEKQFRFPLELGNQRPPSAQWTVTGSGAVILSNDNLGKKCPRVTYITPGKIVDMGVKDANNMGAAMAPAALDTLITHFRDTGRKPSSYDAIITGDLGYIGKEILIEMADSKGYNIKNNYNDCGVLIFDREKQDTHSGGSGCGCIASVFSGYLYKLLNEHKLDKILLIATGALMNSTSSQQGESIPRYCSCYSDRELIIFIERIEFIMDFLQSIDLMQLLRCFVVGGIICIVGQILIDKTKLTSARILVIFVTAGVILGALGIYKYLIDFAGCGATVPLLGFGANLAKGAISEVQSSGLLGAFIGGVKASAGGIAAAIFFGYIASLIAKPKIKKQ